MEGGWCYSLRYIVPLVFMYFRLTRYTFHSLLVQSLCCAFISDLTFTCHGLDQLLRTTLFFHEYKQIPLTTYHAILTLNQPTNLTQQSVVPKSLSLDIDKLILRLPKARTDRTDGIKQFMERICERNMKV